MNHSFGNLANQRQEVSTINRGVPHQRLARQTSRQLKGSTSMMSVL